MSATPDYNHNVPGITPHLIVSNAREAIDFYVRAFGGTSIMEMPAEDGQRLMHAQVLVNGGPLMLCDDFPEWRGGTKAVIGTPHAVTLHMAVPDIDAFYAHAVAEGAEGVMPPADMFWGDRYAQLRDPFGHLWALSTPSKPGAVVEMGGPEPATA
jgi:PhnB protein